MKKRAGGSGNTGEALQGHARRWWDAIPESCATLLTCAALFVPSHVSGGEATAETRALLVGVSRYEAEDEGLTALRGPANDVQLLRDVLERRGVQQIRVLADGVEGARRPTRAAILDELATLAATSAAGDLVYIHFSGHGTQQIDLVGDETEGLDEVWLPIDVAPGEPGSGQIRNALIDDEIGRAVDTIRAAGADVWVVLDSCHSGTALRGGTSRVVPRYVDPAVFGIDVPQQALPGLDSDALAEPDLPGRFLAFYAARSTESAYEVSLAEAEDGDAWYGLFTAKLAARLETHSDLSYRQLFQAVLADLNDSALPGPARLQTPSWEGNLIDATVFGGGEAPAVQRFRVAGNEVMGGLVHGLGAGSVLGLVDDAAAPSDAIIAYAQIERADALRASLRRVGEACVPMQAELCASTGQIPENAAFAQVVGRPLDLAIGMAPPIDARTGVALAAGAPAAQALGTAIQAAAAAGYALRLDPEGYSVETLWADGRLWFGPRTEIGGRPVGLSWAPEDAEPLAPLLVRIHQAESLVRMIGAVPGETSLLNPSPVTVTAELLPVDVAHLEPPGTSVSPALECRVAQARSSTTSVALPPAANLKQCDSLQFSGQGRVPGARDVNRIYIDSNFCIRVDHALIEGIAQAATLGPRMTVCSDCPDGYAAGMERLFVIVTEARERAEPLNLEGILDNCEPAGPVRGALSTALLAFLSERARRPDMRGGPSEFAVSHIWVDSFSWQVLPREEILRRSGGNRLWSNSTE